MDDALRKRLDAIIGLLAVIACLLVVVVAAVGGGPLLAKTLLFGSVFALFGWIAWEDYEDRNGENESVSNEPASDE
ncbi:hypothetical protein [Halorussus pelagicus]|uniref:hypothetical protein n=1 Tax=Halorussus pelagicus TaxID=2505977 RepID=UPI000FFB95A2|nr:hypothetical protein [Halorussus pelagicus]